MYLTFHVFELKEEGKLLHLKQNSYKVTEKRNRVGWVIFRLTDETFTIREGRYKAQLYRLPLRKPPDGLNPTNKHSRTYIDFTIEIFTYTTAENHKFAYRARKKKKVKQ